MVQLCHASTLEPASDFNTDNILTACFVDSRSGSRVFLQYFLTLHFELG
jgi:hypothetical protein